MEDKYNHLRRYYRKNYAKSFKIIPDRTSFILGNKTVLCFRTFP
jgi:hypothetical protein